jgi:hypothetical protein
VSLCVLFVRDRLSLLSAVATEPVTFSKPPTKAPTMAPTSVESMTTASQVGLCPKTGHMIKPDRSNSRGAR